MFVKVGAIFFEPAEVIAFDLRHRVRCCGTVSPFAVVHLRSGAALEFEMEEATAIAYHFRDPGWHFKRRPEQGGDAPYVDLVAELHRATPDDYKRRMSN